jgi:hypothetical protein
MPTPEGGTMNLYLVRKITATEKPDDIPIITVAAKSPTDALADVLRFANPNPKPIMKIAPDHAVAEFWIHEPYLNELVLKSVITASLIWNATEPEPVNLKADALRARVKAWEATVAGYTAENMHRESRGEAMAYGVEIFLEAAANIEALADQIAALSPP